jgi:glycosyltransferase involved in cell wall biosynthesis
MKHPLVSIVIPCRNEARFIEGVLRDIRAQSYPQEQLEVWVVDGRSDDGTREIVDNWSRTNAKVHLLDNPDRYAPYAMNRGIRASEGDIVLRMDAHASYPPDYVEKLVRGLLDTGADNVGGVWITRPRTDGRVAKAIAAVLSHPLGVGNALFRIGTDQPVEADTVPFGCYRREAFEKYGYYDERLHRNQDIELNKRIRARGGRILLLPGVHCTYYARDTYRALWKNNFQNGLWVVRTARLTGSMDSLSLRHFVPLFFAIYLLALLAFALVGLFLAWPLWFWVGAATPFLLYFFATGIAALQIAARERSFLLLPISRIAFLTLHFSYGLGSLKGLTETFFRKK